MAKDNTTIGSANLSTFSALLCLMASLISLPSMASDDLTVKNQQNIVDECLAAAIKTAPPQQTVAELNKRCQVHSKNAAERRFILEREAANNPFAILPHKPNYILPFSYSKVSEQPYEEVLYGRKFDNVEAKYQISLKYIAAQDIFYDGLNFQFAFTAVSWWQSYNAALSAPFRETNYEPEMMLSYTKTWPLFGIPVIYSSLSFNHQSNGNSGTLSRSWNRIIGTMIFQQDNIVWDVKAWWRLPEDEKETLTSLKGDDNPNIERYMGYGEVGAVWLLSDSHNIEVTLRNNFRSDNKGAIEIGYSFPLTKHLRGYIQYFNGYGDGLIYYNVSSQRIGFGVKLTDWL
ncbi:MAG: phospholipase A [Psychrobium sp.]|nr:phospholipase A [Psychrobium sp.]